MDKRRHAEEYQEHLMSPEREVSDPGFASLQRLNDRIVHELIARSIVKKRPARSGSTLIFMLMIVMVSLSSQGCRDYTRRSDFGD